MDTNQPEALAQATKSLAMLRVVSALRDELGQVSLHGSHLVNLIEGFEAANARIAELEAALASQAQPVGAAPAKILAGVIELAKAAHAHWDADRDAKVGKILMAMAGWNEGYDWRADALHAADAAPQPAAQALDADPLQPAANWLVQAHAALEVSTLSGRLSIGFNRAHRLYDAAIAAQQGVK